MQGTLYFVLSREAKLASGVKGQVVLCVYSSGDVQLQVFATLDEWTRLVTRKEA